MDNTQEIKIEYKGEHNTPIIFKGTVNQCIRHLIAMA